MEPSSLKLAPEAELDIEDAFNWYENQQIGLGDRFLETLNAAFLKISHHPFTFRIWYHPYRGYLIPTFPYIILYRTVGSEIHVLSVFHTSRNPKHWQELG